MVIAEVSVENWLSFSWIPNREIQFKSQDHFTLLVPLFTQFMKILLVLFENVL